MSKRGAYLGGHSTFVIPLVACREGIERQQRAAIDRARFAAEMVAYERAPKSVLIKGRDTGGTVTVRSVAAGTTLT